MKNLIIYCLIVFLFACTSEEQNKQTAQHYPISLNKQVELFKQSFQSNEINKLVLQQGIIEKKQIDAAQLLNDINSFKEFDINKPAWINSYKIIRSANYTRFEAIENKLTLKQIDVYGDV